MSGHKAGLAGIYTRANYQTQIRNALALWSDHIGAITTAAERTIVPIREISA